MTKIKTLGWLDKLKLFSGMSKFWDLFYEGVQMKKVTKIVAAVVGFATLLYQAPAISGAVNGVLASHPNIASILGGIGALFALLHDPNAKPAQ